MDISKLKNNKEVVDKGYKVDGDKWIATDNIAITFPSRYMSGAMGNLSNTYNPVGYFATIVGDSYSVMTVPMLFPLRPEKASIYTYKDEEYILLEWTKGGVICDNLRLVQNSSLVYQVHNEFIGRGKSPWYFTVSLRAEIYRNNKPMAGVNLGIGIALESVLVSSITRDKTDRRMQARYGYKSQADYDRSDVVTISLIDIAYGAKGGIARSVGGYMEDGIVAELVDPTETPDKIEQLMRT